MAQFRHCLRGGTIDVVPYIGAHYLEGCEFVELEDPVSTAFYDFLDESGWWRTLEGEGELQGMAMKKDGTGLQTAILLIDRFKSMVVDAGEEFVFLLDKIAIWEEMGAIDVLVNLEENTPLLRSETRW
ncbi:hypothetical protein OTK49_00225 [Vibrio coralliirubri]|uniref:hypothetical protein n=1 Tax=Vibrio coralliirubri TaxID=1516159 RepID=UPI002283E833|nr:hypothetical protein [Vibrio coralliirubri]MCY9860966.1 hypothetical protein [Vibrio coralliirubri]